MTTVHLIHGFNVSDGGKQTVARLKPALEQAGFNVVVHDYGWTFLVRVRLRSFEVVEELSRIVQPGDYLIGHSNGVAIAHMVAQTGIELRGVVGIQAAMQSDALWPANVSNVLALCNTRDYAVEFGRIWRMCNPLSWRWEHYWGAAGRRGFKHDPRVQHWWTDDPVWGTQASGHSGIFADSKIDYWAAKIAKWIGATSVNLQPKVAVGEEANELA